MQSAQTTATIASPVYVDAAYNHGIVTVSLYNSTERTEEAVCHFRNAANALNYAFLLKKRHGHPIAKRAFDLIMWEVKRTNAVSTRAQARATAAIEAAPAPEPTPEPKVEHVEAAPKKGKAETPLLKQYAEMKKKHPDAVLLFRVGDFYETFAEDAITASEILGITLTTRANGRSKKIELAGFPHHALDNYLPKLVRAGKRVAICEQLEEKKK